MGIPIVIIFSWSWWMIIAYILSNWISQLLGLAHLSRNSGFVSKLSFFISGVIIAMIIETTAVFFGWWNYLVIGDKAVFSIPFLNVRFNLAVILGWGILTTINLTFSTVNVKTLMKKFKKSFNLSHYTTLTLSSILLGLISGWVSWQLVSLLAASDFVRRHPIRFFRTGTAPRVHCSRRPVGAGARRK
jgi:hypothetical protein